LSYIISGHLADVAVVHSTAATSTSSGGCVPDLLFGFSAAPSNQAAAARFSPFLLLLLELVLVAAMTGSATRRTGSCGSSRVVCGTLRRLGVANVRAGPALQRARRLVFGPVQLPRQHQQALEQIAHVHVVLGRTFDQLDPVKTIVQSCLRQKFVYV